MSFSSKSVCRFLFCYVLVCRVLLYSVNLALNSRLEKCRSVMSVRGNVMFRSFLYYSLLAIEIRILFFRITMALNLNFNAKKIKDKNGT